MRGGLALAFVIAVGVGGAIGLNVMGPGEEPSLPGPDGNETERSAAGNGTGAEERTREAEDPSGASDEANRSSSNETRLTIDGPTNAREGEAATYRGRLTVGGEARANARVELRIDGNQSARAGTNASGHYEATLTFDEVGDRVVRAAVENATRVGELTSDRLNVTVTERLADTRGEAWPMLAADAARTGSRNTEGPGQRSMEWELETRLDVRGSPAVAGDTVFVGTTGSADCCQPRFLAVNASTGKPVWNVTREAGFGSPVTDGERVFVGAGGELIALDARDGSQRWSRSVDLANVAPAVADGSLVTVESVAAETAVTARSVETGTREWTRSLGGEPRTAPAIANGTVYVGLNATLYALDAAKGATEWTFEAEAPLSSSPSLARGTVVVGAGWNVYGLDAASGQEIWSHEVSGYPADAVPIHDGAAYVATNWGWVSGFEVASGDLVMNGSAEEAVLAAPAVVDGTVYLADRSGPVIALDAGSGAEHWSFPVAGHELEKLVSSPAVVDGRLFVGVDDDCTGCLDTGLIALDAGEPRAG